jgi:hypothetical protein
LTPRLNQDDCGSYLCSPEPPTTTFGDFVNIILGHGACSGNEKTKCQIIISICSVT